MPKEFRSLAELRPSDYNPRRISTKQREALIRSYIEFGDLSGLTVNVATGNIITGHQRTDILKKRATRIIKQQIRDATGTVALGYAIVPVAGGGTMRIPYREVNWKRAKELAANVASNAGGGEFDDVKLGKVMAELQTGRFPIENIPMDAHDIKRAMRMFESNAKREMGMDGEGGEFARVDPKLLKEEAMHACPKCGHRWHGDTKPSFGELHRLTDDHPMKVEARELHREVVRKKKLAMREAARAPREREPRRASRAERGAGR